MALVKSNRSEMYDRAKEKSVAVFPVMEKAPKEKFTIFIYGNGWSAREDREGTRQEHEEYARELIKDGYTISTNPSRIVIYPAHTINKIEMVKS